MSKTIDAKITVESLKERLSYSEETGKFKWVDPTFYKHTEADVGSVDAKGYGVIHLSEGTFKSHRLAWLYVYGVFPKWHIDHINGIPLDNRIANLRDVSRSINMQNQRKARSDNKSGFLGVIANGDKWRAEIRVTGKKRIIGNFTTPEEAHAAYIQVKREVHEGATL